MSEQPEINRDENAAEGPGTVDGDFMGGPESWNLDALPPELDYFRSSEAYQVELSGFQGPMDLLLYLINKEQVDIYDIPISRITDQFIRHIEVMQAISLDTAGEFIAMAATLMVIKMKMLMPSHRDGEEEDEDDPRAELPGLAAEMLERETDPEGRGRIRLEAKDIAGKGSGSSIYKFSYILARAHGAKDWFSGQILYNRAIGKSNGIPNHMEQFPLENRFSGQSGFAQVFFIHGMNHRPEYGEMQA